MITSETMSKNRLYNRYNGSSTGNIAGAVLPTGYSAWIIRCSTCLGCTNDSTNDQVLRRCPICGTKPPPDSYEWVRCECGCNLFCCAVHNDGLIISIVMAPDIIYEEEDII